ncbi:hypothetical protein HNR77_000352 [Paenibacillus sp. JGP012]|uniref:hypothetical protein n=1 Tax=Paenibacillus sp. JGP012 TaxID=2735914 RepID=UPI0016134D46|nr:hypothetical protein [Paenibacillus sp. JGP012]MBB6019295.1 hypothetical protein [Paenibacillus sp. JGP012]
MILGQTTDTSGLTKVAELSDELQPIFEEAAEKYASCISNCTLCSAAFPMNIMTGAFLFSLLF